LEYVEVDYVSGFVIWCCRESEMKLRSAQDQRNSLKGVDRGSVEGENIVEKKGSIKGEGAPTGWVVLMWRHRSVRNVFVVVGRQVRMQRVREVGERSVRNKMLDMGRGEIGKRGRRVT